ncbi:TPR repeat containing protein [Desulfocurvibacter africanus PCS]|uniref:TPR repeat containing protein n=2 Tax=Desulfocurvibacter africanus TaxID=873 RepID=M5Q2U4_DESAF|nr:TPR repeat containing protein [Desulfocurvibacter africanus PCS]
MVFRADRDPYMDDKKAEFVQGIFSTASRTSIGFGPAKGKTENKCYWVADDTRDGCVSLRLLGSDLRPMGSPKNVSMAIFYEKFTPEVELWDFLVLKKVEEGDRHRDCGEYDMAETCYAKALAVDERNVRAAFGLGITYLSVGRAEESNMIFNKLSKLKRGLTQEHKHLFNEFGMALRRKNMLDEAVKYYEKALELAENDENLFLNVARAYLEKGQLERAAEYVKKALALKPDFAEAIAFRKYLEKKGCMDFTFS